MLSIKEQVAKNYKDYPLNERNKTIDIELEEKDYKKLKQLAKNNDISLEEYIFMALTERLNENIFTLTNDDDNNDDVHDSSYIDGE